MHTNDIDILYDDDNSNDGFMQDPRYVAAVNKIREEYLERERKRKRKEPKNCTKSIEQVLAQENIDFNHLRKTINQFSQNKVPNEVNVLENGENRRLKYINEIEKIIETVVEDVTNGVYPKLVLRNKRLWSNCVFGERIELKNVENCQMQIINLRRKKSEKKFTLIMHMLEIIHKMLIKGINCTKRELYYQNIEIVKHQCVMDFIIMDICCLLDAPPWELGILATSKGLVAGPLEIVTEGGQTIHCMNAGGVLIPQNVVCVKSVSSRAKFILVVEKDAIFQKLLDEGALQRLKPCIIITGKGYPDINSRLLLKLLVDSLKIPALALVDCDPHGIEIMCTYRFGSLTMSHIAEKLTVPSLQWIGIHPSDVSKLNIPYLPLTEKDISKCKDLLSRPYCNIELSNQIHIMLRDNMKTELEAVDNNMQAYLTDRYLPYKIISNELI